MSKLDTRTDSTGRQQPATRKPTRADHVAEFPALDIPEAADADVARAADALRTVPPEQVARRTATATRGAGPVVAVTEPETERICHRTVATEEPRLPAGPRS